jgi:hypothetical protein
MIKMKEIKDITFKIESKSLKTTLEEVEAMIKSKIDLINKEEFKNFNLFTPLILDSLIIKDDDIAKKFIEMLPKDKKLELIYRGSRDSFKAEAFHQKVDG